MVDTAPRTRQQYGIYGYDVIRADHQLRDPIGITIPCSRQTHVTILARALIYGE